MNHLSDISDLQNPCNDRARFGRWARVIAVMAALGLAACGGDETPSNNVSNNTTPSNNTSQQTVPNNQENNPPNNPENNPENNPPNNPDCVPTAAGIEICDGIDNDCDGAVDEGYEGLGEPCSLGEGVCEASGVGVCGVDKLGVVCDAQIPAGCGETACLEACEGLTPVCDADSGNCVECLESTDCPDGVCQDFACVECALNSDCNNGVCHNSLCVECVVNVDCPTGACDVPNNTCVECVSDATCSDQVCDTSAFECVDCLLASDCPGDELCKTQTPSTDNVCVQCLANNDCTSAASALCGPTNACLPCQAAADCAHIADANQCSEGTCVECTTATEVADCNGDVCDPATNTCTNSPIGATLPLNPCVSDTQCQANSACVPLTFMSAFHGNYCMPIWTSGSCQSPYGQGIRERTSVSGATQDVCTISELITTPEAISEYGTNCTTNQALCVAPGSSCRQFDAGTSRCTYPCTNNEDCENTNCGPAGNRFCGL